MNGDMSLGVDAKVAFAPMLDLVDIQGVLSFPLLDQFHQKSASSQESGSRIRGPFDS
jgi:hypothetical protein